jgi:hypothetical protein
LGLLTEKSSVTVSLADPRSDECLPIGRDLGYNALHLEAGLRQPAAIRLYGGAGYNRIAAYGRYRGDPMSICYEKIIARNREMK